MPFNRTKALYQPWNEEEFLSDQIVREMNELQSWMYRTLCQKAFCCSTRPYLPDDDDALWRLAGCKNKEQWLKNKVVVLKKFKKVTKHSEDLLYHKRIKTDWDREKKRRQTLANIGSKGGKATHKKHLAYAVPPLQPSSSTELNRTEPNCTEPNRTELDGTDMQQKQLDPVKHIAKTITSKTGVPVNLRSDDRKRLAVLGQTFGGNRVCDAIDGFYAEHPSSTYPGDFLKAASAYLGKPESTGVADSDVLDKLNAMLYTETGVTFSGSNRIALGKLREKYSDNQILAALREFANDPDRNQKYVAKDFAEGGGAAVLLAMERANESEAETQRQLDLINKQLDEQKKAMEAEEPEPEINPEDFL